MKIFEAVKKAAIMINNSDTPQLDAEVILSHILNKDRIYLYLNREKTLDEKTIEAFFEMIERRKNGEPVSYITGTKEFMSLEFIVKPGVLIPRGDTEVLVEEVLKNIKGLKKPIVVDVGCGSGAISVSIAKYKSDAVVYAIDIMDIPLETTRENAEKNGVLDRVNIIKSNMLCSLDRALYNKVDAVVSNPPYIKKEIIPTLMKDIKDYEPYEALCGGEDGLDFYRKITEESLNFIKPGGFLAYEIGHDQKEDVIKILDKAGFADIDCIKDFAGLDRVVAGWRR